MFVHLIWLPSWSVLQPSRPIRGLGDTGSSDVCRGIVSIFIVTMVMILHRIAYLRFWRDVEAKKTRVPVVVAALLVLVDLLLNIHNHLLQPSQYQSKVMISWLLKLQTIPS